jgi:hypothetical protein
MEGERTPEASLATQGGYGVRAPGAVALGTCVPCSTVSFYDEVRRAKTPPPHSP